MLYRAMGLVAASLLFATQCYAEKLANTSRSNNLKQTTQHGAPKDDKTSTFNYGKSNHYRMGGASGGGAQKTK